MENVRLSSVDKLLGILAVASDRLRLESSEGSIGITDNELYQGLAHLQLDKGIDFHLDFDHVGGDYHSRTLEDILFSIKTWKVVHESDRGVYMDPEQSKRQIARLEAGL